MFYGYGDLILQGAWMTIKLAILNAFLAVILGLVGASAKLFGSKISISLATLYSTLIRGIPDLVLMMLIFYGLQIGLNHVTEFFSWSQFNIDPFVAGIITIGFIYEPT